MQALSLGHGGVAWIPISSPGKGKAQSAHPFIHWPSARCVDPGLVFSCSMHSQEGRGRGSELGLGCVPERLCPIATLEPPCVTSF